MAIKNKAEKLRFALVGVANTIIDMGILFTLTAIGLPALLSNIISTTTAFTFSFFANKNYTFKSKGDTKRQLILFVVITLFGLWVLQSIVIWLVTTFLSATTLEKNLTLLIAKLLAITVSLVWNYTFYSRIVFKSQKDIH